MTVKRLLLPDRVRKIEGSFSWIDHRFVTEGFLLDLSMIEILLYLFLVAVSDRNGLSFYHDDRIASLLKIDLPALGRSREVLVRRSLIAYDCPLYQVLSLPPKPIPLPSKEERERQEQEAAHYHFKKIREMLK
ncbi:MAG: hypothetical protein EHM36_00235 [Deltaproteobacteria bacterium]|nr:MAG: hypothetical protein EHM36_00235 [Deltaproteobacteria bacterium]